MLHVAVAVINDWALRVNLMHFNVVSYWKIAFILLNVTGIFSAFTVKTYSVLFKVI